MNYHDFLKDKSVVIVGPAPSIINSNQGKFIDSFDIVVRINKALPIPPKLINDVGTKTDILYNCLKQTSDCGGKINFNLLKNNNVKYLSCPYPPIHPFKNDIAKFNKENKNYINFHHIDAQYYLKISQAMGTRPNSGICAILDILRFPIKKLYITGFTFFKGGYYKEYRPLNENQVLSRMSKFGNHDQNKQKIYMKKVLLNNNKVSLDNELKKILMKTI